MLWYRVEIAGAPAGWMFETEKKNEQELITESTLNLELQRAGSVQTMKLESRFIESTDHRPIEAWTRQQLGAVPMETTYVFGDGTVTVRSASGDRQTAPPAGEWLTPFAATDALREHLRAALEDPTLEPGHRFELRTLDPSLGLKPLITTWQLLERRVTVSLDGEQRVASRWSQIPSYAPAIRSTVDIAANGDILRSVTPMMGLEMTVTLSSKDAALHGRDKSAAAPELLVPSFLYPDKPIPRPRETKTAVYHLKIDGDMPELPTSPIQKVEILDGEAKVHIDLNAEPIETELEDPDLYLRSTDFLRHDDARIRQLTKRATPKNDSASGVDPAELAETFRRFVAGYLTEKNLDSILATASEAATSKAGDCTEHAVLLAAMLRAAGIPSRVATGVIYAESFAGKRDLFAYHMWSQAWLGGAWVDLDATLPDSVAFDAAHILMGVSALDDGAAALVDMAAASPLIGRVEIGVEQVGWGR